MNDQHYVYWVSEPGLYTVGYFDTEGKRQPESDHETKELAAERVSYLNGNCMARHGQPRCYPIDEHLILHIYQALYDHQDSQQVIHCVNELNRQFKLSGLIEHEYVAIDARSFGDNEDDNQA